MIFESPSKDDWVIPTSRANKTALLPASDSNITTEGGKGIFSDKAAIISPLDFRITTSIPASFEFLKTAPSKFVLKESKGGGDHFFLPLLAEMESV